LTSLDRDNASLDHNSPGPEIQWGLTRHVNPIILPTLLTTLNHYLDCSIPLKKEKGDRMVGICMGERGRKKMRQNQDVKKKPQKQK
jgi:hypothetical protein